jgi:S-adenosylmethionine:tRNA ribosyltransferase-isomerase
MKLQDFDYHLPDELIAQEPPAERSGSRLMLLDKTRKLIEHKNFPNLIEYLNPGDLLVFNDTRVIPARLFGYKEETSGKVEILLMNQTGDNEWEAMIKPGRKIKPGHTLVLGNGTIRGEVVKRTDKGTRIIRFLSDNFHEALMRDGEIPLPPYIRKPIQDTERYQTVFAKNEGSSAAPTAALHFDKEFFERLNEKGIEHTFVTLHIGPGTFVPVKTENITEHQMHREYFIVPPDSLETIIKAKTEGRRVIAVGTTAVRTLESVFNEDYSISRTEGWTEIFIYPGYSYKIVDGLITNFHLPRSTLLMLVSAFADRDFILKAYNEAVSEKYRFFSFGDCMFIY